MSQIQPGQVPDYNEIQPSETAMAAGYGSAWQGWVAFAAVMMIILGIFNLIDGFVALTSDDVFLVDEEELLVLTFTAWGWFLMAIGAIQVAAGIGVGRGKTWARVVGVVMAGLNAIAQISYVNAHPFWSVLIIAVDVMVIYALTAHGREFA
jgi:hypothetical protein